MRGPYSYSLFSLPVTGRNPSHFTGGAAAVLTLCSAAPFFTQIQNMVNKILHHIGTALPVAGFLFHQTTGGARHLGECSRAPFYQCHQAMAA